MLYRCLGKSCNGLLANKTTSYHGHGGSHALKAQRQVLNYRLINSFARDKNYNCVQRKGIIFVKR